MRLRFFLHIAYKGTRYHGWQRQPNVSSVQQTIEDRLSKIFGKKINVHGCGRTDAGVHARSYYLHIDLEVAPDFDLVFRLNKILPNDIVLKAYHQVDDSANAQKDATLRYYEYRFHQVPDPFLNDLSTLVEGELNMVLMEEAIEMIRYANDFRHLCKSPDQYANPKARIDEARLIKKQEEGQYIFRIGANRFLHHMVRLIVGNLLLVAKGKISPQQFYEYLHPEVYPDARPEYFNLADPRGLYLVEVKY